MILTVGTRKAGKPGCPVPLAVGRWYDFHTFGWHLENLCKMCNNLIRTYYLAPDQILTLYYQHHNFRYKILNIKRIFIKRDILEYRIYKIFYNKRKILFPGTLFQIFLAHQFFKNMFLNHRPNGLLTITLNGLLTMTMVI